MMNKVQNLIESANSQSAYIDKFLIKKFPSGTLYEYIKKNIKNGYLL